MLNPRERRLLTIVLVVVGGYIAYGLLQWFVLEPLRSRQAQLATLQTEISRKRLQQRQVLRAQEQYEAWLKKSLPSDIPRAQSMYQEFLLTAVSAAGLSDASVTTMPPSPQGDVMTRLPYTVRGRGSLRQLVELLRYFYGVDVLHEIRQLIVRRRNGGDELDIEMRVEAVALKDAPTEFEGTLKPTPESLAALGIEVSLTRLITEKNILSPYRPPPPIVGEAAARSAPPIDEREFIYAVGCVVAGGQEEIWFYDRLNNKLYRLREGESFEFGGVHGRVVRIDGRGVVLEVTESPPREVTVLLGQNLKQALQTGRAESAGEGDGGESAGVALSDSPP